MMKQRDFVIVTDVNADLPTTYTEAEHIGIISMHIQIDKKSYEAGKDIDSDTFFQMMREGGLPTTSAANPCQYEQAFMDILDDEKDVLYLAFSSALSSSYQSAVIARESLEEKNEDLTNRIVIIDTLSGSMGQGLLVYKANQLKKQGKSINEVAQWCEQHKLNVCHEFVLDDLMHMHRGGRLSKTSAMIGSLIHVKPFIHLNHESKVLSSGHVRGRKKAIQKLIERMEKNMVNFTSVNQEMIMICHSGCEQDALMLKEKITEKFGLKNIMVHTAGPVIGCHAGPGALGVFFMGKRCEA